jgi:hypothetical protein
VICAAILLVPMAAAPAHAQGRLVDEDGYRVDALRGVAVWARPYARDGAVLMRRIDGRTSRIPRVKPIASPIGMDLGIDRNGRLVLVYGRCDLGGSCRGPFIVDVRRGGERRLTVQTRRGCVPGPTASVWRRVTAFTLRCGDDSSGVYMVDDGRLRRLIPLTFSEAKYAEIDLTARYVSHYRDIASTGKERCRSELPPSPPRYKVSEVHAGPDRVWWLRELVGDWGGGESELVSAAVGPDCQLTLLGNPRPLDPLRLRSSPPLADGLAIDRNTLYLTGEGIGVTISELPPEATATPSPEQPGG